MGKRGAKKCEEPEAPCATNEAPAEPKKAAKAKAKGKSKAKAEPKAEAKVDLSWDNIEQVMEHFDLKRDEAEQALEEILGPKPGSKAW